MNQQLNIYIWQRFILKLCGLMLLVVFIVSIFLTFNIARISSIISQLSSDNFTLSLESLKYSYSLLSILSSIATSLILFLAYKILSWAFDKSPTAIIENNGIRYPANPFQPESFLHWNNIKSFKRMKLGPIKGVIFIRAKNPKEAWSQNLFVLKIWNWIFRILSLGLWRGELYLNTFGLGSFKEFSNDELEKMLREITLMPLPETNAPVTWKNNRTAKNRQTVLLSFTLPVLAIALGFASHHYSYLWDEEANTTRIIRHFAHQGNPDAQTKLGWRYSNGVGTYQHHPEAVYWYKKAAEQGYAKSQYNLGNAYYSGIGIKRDYDKAFQLFMLAAEQNQPNSFNGLAKMYHTGRGVEKSYKKAHELYNKAISLGLTYPNASLGYMYEKGEGVQASKEIAIEYYKKAATDNNKYAIKALKRLGAT